MNSFAQRVSNSRFAGLYCYSAISLGLLTLCQPIYADVSDFAATFKNNTGSTVTLQSMIQRDSPLKMDVPVGQVVSVPLPGWSNPGDKHVYIEVKGNNTQYCTKSTSPENFHQYGTKFDIGKAWDVNPDQVCPIATDLTPAPPAPPPPIVAPVISGLPSVIEGVAGVSVSYSGSVSGASSVTFSSPNPAGGVTASHSGDSVSLNGTLTKVGSYNIVTTASNSAGSTTFTTEITVRDQVSSGGPIPRTVSAWLYDASGGNHTPGQFVNHIASASNPLFPATKDGSVGWNKIANYSDRLIELYTYGTDMEMYDNSLETYYLPPSKVSTAGGFDKNIFVGPANLALYKAAIPELQFMSPIIDGRTDTGYLKDFNQLTTKQAIEYADLVSFQACLDSQLDGLQIDVEPLNFVVSNPASPAMPTQVAFYLRIADNFSSVTRDPSLGYASHIGAVEKDVLSACRNKHRYVSVFTFASNLQAALLANGKEAVSELLSRDNFLVVDSLYDLPPGTTSPLMTDPLVYYQYVKEEVQAMLDLSDKYRFNFKFAIPASCSFHECATTGNQSHSQKDYAVAAINAIGEFSSRICNNPRFKGIAIWAFDYHNATWDGQQFDIKPPSMDVMNGLLQNGTYTVKGASGSVAMKTGMSHAIGCPINQ